MRDKVAIYGAGNGGKLFAEIAKQCGYDVECFIDDNKRGMVDGLYIAAPYQFRGLCPVVVAIMDNTTRLKIAEGLSIVSLIHPTAYVFPTAKIGRGTLIKPHAVVGNNVEVGECCIIDSGVIIEHDSVLGDGVFVSVGSDIGSSVQIGNRTLIGIGCNIQTGVKVGSDCVIVSGSTIFSDVADNYTVKREIKL